AADAALAAAPGDAELLGLRARALARLDAEPATRGDAEEQWLAAVGEGVLDPGVVSELRAASARAGDHRALARWLRALAEAATTPRGRARLLREAASASEKAGQHDDAAAALEAALEADPSQLGALDALIRLLAPAQRWSYVA